MSKIETNALIKNWNRIFDGFPVEFPAPGNGVHDFNWNAQRSACSDDERRVLVPRARLLACSKRKGELDEIRSGNVHCKTVQDALNWLDAQSADITGDGSRLVAMVGSPTRAGDRLEAIEFILSDNDNILDVDLFPVTANDPYHHTAAKSIDVTEIPVCVCLHDMGTHIKESLYEIEDALRAEALRGNVHTVRMARISRHLIEDADNVVGNEIFWHIDAAQIYGITPFLIQVMKLPGFSRIIIDDEAGISYSTAPHFSAMVIHCYYPDEEELFTQWLLKERNDEV